jgi:hypothetical protein
MDPHYFEKTESGFALDEKLDPHPQMSKFRSCRGSKWSHGGQCLLTVEAWRLSLGGSVVQWLQIHIALTRSRIRIRMKMERLTRNHVKIEERNSDPHSGCRFVTMLLCINLSSCGHYL